MSQHLKKILILALGGEGGGTLTEWVVDTCRAHGWPNQATSIPGVAQRTGGTSYYIECLAQDSPAVVPPMCLAPMAGDLDLIVSSELLETARAVERGLATPDRTLIVSSSARALTVDERTAMGDGRWSGKVLEAGITSLAREAFILDMGALARSEGTIVSAVMFGALSASGVLPLRRELCEQVISADGPQARVAASLRGFAAGWDAVNKRAGRTTSGDVAERNERSERKVIDVEEMVRHGAARLLDYQDQAYADLYRQRVGRVLSKDVAPFCVSQEAARGLALWMSYEDVIRVADLKSRRARFDQIRADYKAGDGEPVIVRDFLKPRAEEIAAILPPAWAARVLRWAARRPARQGEGIALNTSSVGGLMAMRVLASMRWMRLRSARFAAEQALIDRWLEALLSALTLDSALARSVALLPDLIKGYGDTHARGQGNFVRIMETLLEPGLKAVREGKQSAGELAAACDAARQAALADPEGREVLRQLGLPEAPVREQTLHFMRPVRRKRSG